MENNPIYNPLVNPSEVYEDFQFWDAIRLLKKASGRNLIYARSKTFLSGWSRCMIRSVILWEKAVLPFPSGVAQFAYAEGLPPSCGETWFGFPILSKGDCSVTVKIDLDTQLSFKEFNS